MNQEKQLDPCQHGERSRHKEVNPQVLHSIDIGQQRGTASSGFDFEIDVVRSSQRMDEETN
jgi:hypothetical protein